MTLDKFLEDIDCADLRRLIENKVSAGKAIEYKECLPDDTYESQKEFLAEVSSFANTSGGHLLYGVKEKNGIPVALPGIGSLDPDCEIRRLERLLRDNIQPQCQGILIRAIETDFGHPILILRIPESWSKPHVVNFQGHWRFYARNSAGKHSLDITEVKAACLATAGLGERIRSFHLDRLNRVSSDDVPVPLMGKVRTVFHLIPYSAFASSPSLSFAGIDDIWSIPLMYANASSYRYNLEGLIVYHEREESGFSEGYTQVFRNGIIESVNANLFGSSVEGPYIPRLTFESDVTGFLDACIAFYRKLSVSMPVVLFVTLVGMQDYKLAMQRQLGTWHNNVERVPRDLLLLPKVIVEDMAVNSATLMKPIFKAVWNSIGWERYHGYEENVQRDLILPGKKLAGERVEVSRGAKAKRG